MCGIDGGSGALLGLTWFLLPCDHESTSDDVPLTTQHHRPQAISSEQTPGKVAVKALHTLRQSNALMSTAQDL
jgi:hypothetical protein